MKPAKLQQVKKDVDGRIATVLKTIPAEAGPEPVRAIQSIRDALQGGLEVIKLVLSLWDALSQGLDMNNPDAHRLNQLLDQYR